MANPDARARFLTPAEVADLLRVSSMTVYRLIKAGDMAAVRVGKSYRVREDDVDRYLASRYNATSSANNPACACTVSPNPTPSVNTARTSNRAHTSSNAAANTGNAVYNPKPIPARCEP